MRQSAHNLPTCGCATPPARRHLPVSCCGDDLYRAGTMVAPGVYRQIGGTHRVVRFLFEDTLPGSLDGQVALYEKIQVLGTSTSAIPKTV